MRFAIPALLKIVKRNPYTALAIAGVSGIGLISKLLPKSEESTVESGDIKGIENFKDTGELPDIVTKFNQGGIVNNQILKYNQGGMVPVMLTKGEYVVPPNQAQNIGASTLYAINNAKNYNQGGLIPGRGPNVDTVRTQLREGSFVIKRPAVDALGSNNIHNFVSNYNQGGIVGGLRLPRTGRVMAPKSSPGGTYNQDGGTVQKFLGITVPGSYRRTGYTPTDIGRYNRLSKNNYLEEFEAGLRPETYSPDFYQYAEKMGINTEGAHRVRKKQKPSSTSILNTGSNNTRLNKAIESANQIGDMTGTQGLMRKASGTALQMQDRYDTLRDVMRRGGISGADETMNLYGKPMLGPQSRVSPVDMPQTMSKMQTIVLPPTTMQAKKSPNQGSAATELPSFSISRDSSSMVSNYLGIG